MNHITIANIFHIIYNTVFMSYFATKQLKRGFFGPILNHFANMEVNDYRMLSIHCFVWLKDISYLERLQSQIQNNVKFSQNLSLF